MIRLIIILLLSSILSLFYSCEKVKDRDTSIQVYKFQNVKDYSDNVPVELSDDKNKITSSPGTLSTRWPVRLIDGYYLGGSMGVNSGYLSLTIEEFNSYEIKPALDSLYILLVEKDPYLEFYERNDNDDTFSDENGANGIDTALINDLIRTDNLEQYFDRLK